MSTITVHVGLIEWDSSETPDIVLRSTLQEAQFDIANMLYAQTRDWDTDDLADFWSEFPEPPVDDAVLLDIWHEGYREATTAPWATFYTEQLTLKEEEK